MFLWFPDIAECQSPTETTPFRDSPQPLFPLSYCDGSSPSRCDSPMSQIPPLHQDNKFTRCSPSPSLSPTSPTITIPPSSPNLQSPDYALQTVYGPYSVLADSASIHFIDLKETYEKTQVRRGGISEQRLVDCRVHMLANFSKTYTHIEVYVHRYPETGEVEDKMLFPITVEKTLPNMVGILKTSRRRSVFTNLINWRWENLRAILWRWENVPLGHDDDTTHIHTYDLVEVAMYICWYVHVRICTYVQKHTSIHAFTHVHPHISTCTYISTYVYMSKCM